MNVSGLLLRVRPESFDEVRAAVATLPGLDVFDGDPATGRLVVTQETDDTSAQVTGLERLRALPGVVGADLVYHRFDADPGEPDRPRR